MSKNIKKKFILSIILIIVFIFSGCSLNENNSNNITDIQNDTTITTNQNIENNLDDGSYVISSLPGNIEVPDEYNVYSLDNEFTEEMCKDNSVTSEVVKKYLSLSENLTNIKMIIIPKGETFDNSNFIIEIKVKSNKDYGVDNYKDLDEGTFDLEAKSLVKGFGNSDYSVIEESNLKYVVFDPNSISNERRLATIINGKMVYFIAKYEGDKISDNENSDLSKIALSLDY